MHVRSFRSTSQPRRRKWHWRGWTLLVALIFVAYVFFCAVVVPRHSYAGSNLAIAQADHIAAPTQLQWPAYGQAAVGATGYGVLASHGSSTPLPTASVAKIITALCVLKKYPLAAGQSGPTITMGQQDVAFYNSYLAKDGSVIAVRAGQQLSELQALQAMLLRSANNMADSLAVWAFGSLANYATFANNYVQQLGLSQTTIGNDASGFDPSTTSTASDLVRLGEAALQKSALAGVVGQHSATIPEVGTIYNTNDLLGQDGIIGIKTGNSDQDKGVYLYAANYVQGGQSIVVFGAIMGAPKLTTAKQDSLNLLKSTERGFSPHTLVHTGQAVAIYRLPWGATNKVLAQSDLTLFGWQSRVPVTHLELQKLHPPVKTGQTVGTMSTQGATGKTYSTSLTLAAPMPKPSLWWRLSHPLQ